MSYLFILWFFISSCFVLFALFPLFSLLFSFTFVYAGDNRVVNSSLAAMHFSEDAFACTSVQMCSDAKAVNSSGLRIVFDVSAHPSLLLRSDLQLRVHPQIWILFQFSLYNPHMLMRGGCAPSENTTCRQKHHRPSNHGNVLCTQMHANATSCFSVKLL